MLFLSYCTTVLLLTTASASTQKTLFNGDVVNGVPVITKLDLNDVPSNAITRYYFKAAEAQGTINYYVPVFVARGTKESLKTGRRLSLSSTVHGDEYNGVRVVQKVFADLEHHVKAGKLNGTIIGIPTLNMNGIMHNQRNFFSSSENGFLTNLNRVFPGVDPKDPTLGATLPETYAYNIWTGIWGNTTNVDIAVDLHTLTLGSTGPMWVYADYNLPYNPHLATLTQADIIKIDPGEPGSIETSFVQNRIPAITLELGPPISWDHDLITRGYEFIFRLLDDLQMLPPNSQKSNSKTKSQKSKTITPSTFIATNRIDIPCTRAGWAQGLVKVLDDVKKGQEVVRIFDSWGNVVERVRAPGAARVLQIKSDPPVEMGSVVIVLVNNATST